MKCLWFCAILFSFKGACRLLPVRGSRPFCWGSFSKSCLVLGGHFQIREHCLGVFLNQFRESRWVSSNERELRLKEPAVNTKHRSVDKVYGEARHDLWLEYLWFPQQLDGGSLSQYVKFMGKGLDISKKLGWTGESVWKFSKLSQNAASPPPPPPPDSPRTHR